MQSFPDISTLFCPISGCRVYPIDNVHVSGKNDLNKKSFRQFLFFVLVLVLFND